MASLTNAVSESKTTKLLRLIHFTSSFRPHDLLKLPLNRRIKEGSDLFSRPSCTIKFNVCLVKAEKPLLVIQTLPENNFATCSSGLIFY
jgi:hypothetical protein